MRTASLPALCLSLLASCASSSAPDVGAGGGTGGSGPVLGGRGGGAMGRGGAGGGAPTDGGGQQPDLAIQADAAPDAGAAELPPSDSAGSDGPSAEVPTADRPPSTGGFRHPGVMVTREQLDFIKGKIAAGAEPWTSALARLKASRWAAPGYTATPFEVVQCGPYSNPNVGCSAELSDAIAAYSHALLWAFTGDTANAQTAVRIMNAWAATLKSHTNHNAPLQAAWASEVWPRAAEIIRYTYDGWSATDVARFATLLETVYLPRVIKGSAGNGNWELSMIEAAMGIAVFLDDRATFDKAVAMWRRRVPAYIYLSSDGPQPVAPPASGKSLIALWYGQTRFVDGLGQETCRDFGHLTGGFSAMLNAAETAWIQGVDLYREEARRLAAGLEFNGQFLDGAPVPDWLCGGKLKLQPNDTWEIGYNALATRLGLALPHTKAIIAKIRPTGANHHMVWESMTHAELGNVGDARSVP